jgi:hypothetical protein
LRKLLRRRALRALECAASIAYITPSRVSADR